MKTLADWMTAATHHSIARDRIEARSLRDTAAHAITIDVHAHGAPSSLAEWNARQLSLAYAIADAFDVDPMDALATVAKVFPTIAPRVYA